MAFFDASKGGKAKGNITNGTGVGVAVGIGVAVGLGVAVGRGIPVAFGDGIMPGNLCTMRELGLILG